MTQKVFEDNRIDDSNASIYSVIFMSSDFENQLIKGRDLGLIDQELAILNELTGVNAIHQARFLEGIISAYNYIFGLSLELTCGYDDYIVQQI